MRRTFLVAGFAALCHVAEGAAAVDISDTRRLLFVGDREANVIAVVDPRRAERIDLIETPSPVHALIVTPHAPLLLYANRDERVLHIFNLATRQWLERIALPVKKGDAILTHGLLVHGGDKIRDRSLTRYSSVIHYTVPGGDRMHEVEGPFNW